VSFVRDDELPRQAVRDLLGIVRALYGWHRALNSNDERLPVLHTIGRKLAMALELSRAKPGTLGHSAALNHTEDAVAMLGEVLCASAGLGDVFTTAKRRALTRASSLTGTEQRRRARLTRG